jgi:SOS response regulatory protein OraA/RecX
LTYAGNTVINELCFLLADDTDFLELFTEEKEEKEKGEDKDNSLEDFFNDNPGNVVRKLKEIYPDVVSDIVEEVIHDIRNYDLDDSDVEYFAEEYIRDNPVASVEVAEEYLDSDDKKSFIHSWIDEI